MTLGLLAVLALAWGGLVKGASRWGDAFRLDPQEQPCHHTVRVVVPARNEAGNVGPCVAALCATACASWELVVVDDGSTDGTAAEALSAAAGAANVRVLAASERPAGWSGKAWACQCGAEGAQAEWLLFLDADVVVHPLALATVVERAARVDADLLSVFGRWRLESFWERVAIPSIGWFIRAAASPDLVNAGRAAFANGQLLLVRRSAWSALGGHEVVRSDVLDDVRYAEAAWRAGQRLWLFWGPEIFSVRLYDSLSAIWAGYQKNLYQGMGRRPVVALAAAGAVAVGTLLPALGIPVFGLLGWHAHAAVCVVIYALMTAWRAILERKDGRSGLVAPLHPLGAAVLVGVLLASMLQREVAWKGRAFVGGDAS